MRIDGIPILILIVSILLSLFAFACSDDAEKDLSGQLNQPCREDNSCDSGLKCDFISYKCVEIVDGDSDVEQEMEDDPTKRPSTCSKSDCGSGACYIKDDEAYCECPTGYVDELAKCVKATCKNCGEFISVVGGSFIMGSDAGGEFERPEHKVTLTDYSIHKTEVTIEMVLEFLNAFKTHDDCGENGFGGGQKCLTLNSENQESPYKKSGDVYESVADDNQIPANFISWYGAKTYCKWLGADLSTEARWEFVARTSAGNKFPWGNEEDLDKGKRANCRETQCNDGFEKAAKVGSFPDGNTKSGVVDLSGNISEWTLDWLDKYTKYDATNPTGAGSGSARVIRGGSYDSRASELGATYRNSETPETMKAEIGFRCVK